MNKMGIFFAGAFVGSLTTFITMCLASCSKPEAENDQHKRQVEELTEKHWNECRQIAHYDDELREYTREHIADRWISFKDKQPQEGGFYLTYYAEHIHVSQWFASKNWYNEHGGNVTNMVEYWQPLPEPPKDGEDNE